jgi:type II secretory pathway pseudopilin PulG
MKTPSLSSADPLTLRQERAFTFAEMMVATALFTMLMAGIIYGYIFGLNLYQITKVKLGANDDARKAIIKLTDDIRSAWRIQVGSVSSTNLTNFSQCGATNIQQGNAIKVFPNTNDWNSWVLYYFDSNQVDAFSNYNTNFTKLMRTTNGSTATQLLSHSITNNMLFTSEDCNGNILSNSLNNRVIGVTLQFYQIEYPIVHIGPGNYYDFYQLHTRITRRTLN